MNLSYYLLFNHMEAGLRDTVVREYNSFSDNQKGGPLLFKIMMNVLIQGNETSLQALVVTVGKYNIAIDAKDDVREALQILQAAGKAIISMRTDASNPGFPPNFVETCLKTMATTSCEEFNNCMTLLLKDAEHLRKLGRSSSITNDETGLQQAISFAGKTLTDLERDGTWKSTVSSNSDKQSSFVSAESTCFNCGKKGCTPKTCKDPIDKD